MHAAQRAFGRNVSALWLAGEMPDRGIHSHVPVRTSGLEHVERDVYCFGLLLPSAPRGGHWSGRLRRRYRYRGHRRNRGHTPLYGHREKRISRGLYFRSHLLDGSPSETGHAGPPAPPLAAWTDPDPVEEPRHDFQPQVRNRRHAEHALSPAHRSLRMRGGSAGISCHPPHFPHSGAYALVNRFPLSGAFHWLRYLVVYGVGGAGRGHAQALSPVE